MRMRERYRYLAKRRKSLAVAPVPNEALHGRHVALGGSIRRQAWSNAWRGRLSRRYIYD
jgi:hypothetical protein